MNKFKLTALLLALVMMLGLLSSCGGQQSEEPGENPGTPSGAEQPGTTNEPSTGNTDGVKHLNAGYGSDPGTLDPFSSWSGGRYQILPFTYERLASWSDEGSVLAPNLAEKWENLGNNTFRFYLHDGITDSQGNVFNADDVVWVIEESLERGTNTNALYVKSVEKVNDLTVDVTLNDSSVGIFEAFCNGVFYCTQEAFEASEDGMSTDPVGTGPYIISHVEMGTSYEFTKREDYWQSPDKLTNPDQYAVWDTITVTIISEAAQQVVGLQTGTLDFMEVNAETASNFLDDPNYTVLAPQANNGTFLYLNMHDGSVLKDNIALRRAIFYGFDAQDICDGAYDGYADPAVTFGANIYTDCDPNWTVENYFHYDDEYARAQLAESGYGDGITLRLLCSNSGPYSKTANIIQAYLGQIGINVEVNAVESALYETYKLDWTQWDMCLDNKGAADYLANYIRTKLSPTSYSDEVYTCCFIRDDQLDSLVAKAIDSSTHSAETVAAVHDYLLEGCFARGLVCPTKVFVFRNAVIKDVTFNADYKHEYGKFTPAQ